MPKIRRKPNYKQQQQERSALVDFIERHRILKNDNLETETKEETEEYEH